MAVLRLEEFEDEWDKRYPAIGQAWRRAWEDVVPFFAFAPGVREMIYSTNAVEALNRSLRKIIETRGSFPNDDAALKLLYLAKMALLRSYVLNKILSKSSGPYRLPSSSVIYTCQPDL